MKKLYLLLLVGVLPLFGFGQTNLVRWNGANLQPNAFLIVNNGTISANPVSGNFVTDNYTQPFSGFRGSNYNTSNSTPDYTNFIGFQFTVNSGENIPLNNFTFTYARGDGGPRRFEVRYSLDGLTWVSKGHTNGVDTSPSLKTISLTGVTVNMGSTFYIRVYPYSRQNQYWSGGTFHIKHGTTHAAATDDGSGPTLSRAAVAPCTPSTAPTSIVGNATICSGTNVNLQATGGSEGTNNLYQWGTGSVGSNIIAGQTTSNLSHVPTGTTTYWVRRANCNTTTAAVTKTVTVGFGDQNTYTTNFWTGYAYTYTGTPAATTYIGYVEENETFDRNNNSGAISGRGANNGRNNLCAIPSDNFLIRYRMKKTFPAGTYTITVGGDDGYRLSTDNGATWILGDYTEHNYNTKSAVVCFDGTTPTNFLLEYFEIGGDSRISFNYVSGGNASAPTQIVANDEACNGDLLTLTASGGIGSLYQWGTGTIGNNIISNATGASITVPFSATTTYWVRRVASTCVGSTTTTAGISKTVTLNVPAGDPTQFGTSSWNVYAFKNQSMTPTSANYLGFYTQNTLGCDTQDLANNGWSNSVSPSSSAGWNGCNVAADNFTFVHKRRGFTAGSYQLVVRNYDDATRILINGKQVRNYAGWFGGNADYADDLGIICLNENSTVEVITNENAGQASFRMTIVAVNAVYANSGWNGNTNPANKDVELQNNLTLPNDLTVCSCTVKAGTTLIIPANRTFTVIGDVTVEATGKIIVENNGSFIQINDNAAFTGATNSFTMNRNTQPVFRFDFTYWSSPVKESAGFTLNNLSPQTTPTRYMKWRHTTTPQAWQMILNGTEVMVPGRGYIVRAPQNYNIEGAGAPQEYPAAFIGVPNNGPITHAVTGSTTVNAWNLIGNPYPSALDATTFMNANSTTLGGTLYFWTHNTAFNAGSGFSYSASDYASWNGTGGVATVGEGNGHDNFNIPTGRIAAGQSFFVQGIGDGAGSISFDNTMRVAGNNNQFFRPTPTQPMDDWQITGKHRIWLNLKGETQGFNQTLVGYIPSATNGLDNLYDGASFGGNQVTFYSVLEAKNLVIQGRALPFSDQDEVPLGYKTTLTGTLTISIDQIDGLLEGQDIFIKDNVLNIVHDLKDTAYSFTTIPGTFNDRFVLRYLPEAALSTNTPIIDHNSILVFNSNNQISIKSTEQVISKVEIFDLQGRMIFTKNNINAQTFATQSLSISNQVIVVKVTTDENAELVKKIVLK